MRTSPVILLPVICVLFPVMEMTPPGVLTMAGVLIVKPESLKSLASTVIECPNQEDDRLIASGGDV